jgi:cobalamin biosynthesis protein CbiG
MGCRRGVSAEEVRERVLEFFTSRKGSSNFPGLEDVRAAATIDLKRDEGGLIRAMGELDLPLLFFSSRQINSYCGDFTETEASIRQLGVKAVAEPCALLAGKGARLHTGKQVLGKLTLALAEEAPGLPDDLPNTANTASTGTE